MSGSLDELSEETCRCGDGGRSQSRVRAESEPSQSRVRACIVPTRRGFAKEADLTEGAGSKMRKSWPVRHAHRLVGGETIPMRKPPSGEPYAGEPHVRFGGRGSESCPYPYHITLALSKRSMGREASHRHLREDDVGLVCMSKLMPVSEAAFYVSIAQKNV